MKLRTQNQDESRWIKHAKMLKTAQPQAWLQISIRVLCDCCTLPSKDLPDLPPVDPRLWRLETQKRNFLGITVLESGPFMSVQPWRQLSQEDFPLADHICGMVLRSIDSLSDSTSQANPEICDASLSSASHCICSACKTLSPSKLR